MKNFLNFKIIIAIVIDFILSGLAINISNYIRLNVLRNHINSDRFSNNLQII